MGTSDLTIAFQANLRSRLHVFGYTGADSPFKASKTADTAATWTGLGDYFSDYLNGATEPAKPDPLTSNASGDGTISDTRYHFYLAWQNPDAQGAVTYDGIEAKIAYTLTPDAAWSGDFV